ncbi:sugar phosphate isomerase/epimerase [Nitrosopumilus sp.]|nr:sugar phosphate isomerase/epimerase [Nitrosopumilus sp.]
MEKNELNRMAKKVKIGIMQGRLSEQYTDQIQAFPINSWKLEFEKAKNCGFEVIEWIFDTVHPNPILTNEGRLEIVELSKNNNININSVCADYFMEKKLFSETSENIEKNLEKLNELINCCINLNISCIEIPFVDSSSLKTDENRNELIKNLEKILECVEKNNIFIGLETDLNPANFKKLIEQINHPNIKINYDSGNSASLQYNVIEEFNILDKWIQNVHVKDRKINAGTVPLGTGDTNFEEFFSMLSKMEYSGDLIIQGARQSEINFKPIETCQIYHKFVKQYVDKYYI